MVSMAAHVGQMVGLARALQALMRNSLVGKKLRRVARPRWGEPHQLSYMSLDGYRVKRYLGVESVEFVIGTGAFSEISSSLSDFFGARSSAFEGKLRQAKNHALDALKYAA